MFHKKGVLKDFETFTRNYPCRSLFFNKVADLRPEFAQNCKQCPGSNLSSEKQAQELTQRIKKRN